MNLIGANSLGVHMETYSFTCPDFIAIIISEHVIYYKFLQ
jgi:hypothetical protein